MTPATNAATSGSSTPPTDPKGAPIALPWLRLDDNFSHHPKILGLGTDERRWTWQCVLLYTCRYSTDEVPATIRDAIPKATAAFLRDCVALGLLDEDDDGILHVHDWRDYNGPDSKLQVRDRVRRHREKRERNATGNAEVTAEVTQPAVTNALRNRDSRAAARARPVPNPYTPSPNPFPNPGNDDDDEQLNQALNGIHLTGPARTAALELQTTDPKRLQACVTASLTATKPAAYLAELIRNGSHPQTPNPVPHAPDPTAVCDDCGEKLGHGHLETCSRMPVVVDDPDPAAARAIVGPPAELLATVGVRVDDPEPRSDPEPRTGVPSDPVNETTSEEAA